MNEKTKILVTGAAGFVGSALIRKLQELEKFAVYGLVGKHRNIGIDNQKGLEKIFRGDISDYASLRSAETLKNIDVLVHTAGLAHRFGRVKKEDFWRVNVFGTENICRLSQKIGVRHLILISSVAVYGDYGNAEIDETFSCHPEGFYAESKLESESKAIEFCQRNNIQLTILRPATIVGEGDRGNTTRLITLIDRSRFIWIGNGANKKSLIDKADVAEGILRAAQTSIKSGTQIYNLTGEIVSMKEIVTSIARNLNKKTPRLKIPEKIIRAFFLINKSGISIEALEKFEKTFEKWLSDDIFSGKKFSEKYNFKPVKTVNEALSEQVNYYLFEK